MKPFLSIINDPSQIGEIAVMAYTEQKRLYTRGTLRIIKISLLAKISTLYRDWLRSLMKKRVNHLSCIEGKGVVETLTKVHKCRAIC